jgi:glycosyltransferase involved in cell wall biosynthesis
MTRRTLLVIGDDIRAPSTADRPRADYDALAARLSADILHAGEVAGVGRRGRGGIALARAAAKRAGDYDNVYCDSEHIGLPLAFLLRGSGRPRLTMIGHYLSPLKKRLALRAPGVRARIATMVVHSPGQVARARAAGLRPEQIALMPYHVDTTFWRPDVTREMTHIGSAGREFRDYATLIEAVHGLPVAVEIAAGSVWSTRRMDVGSGALPENVLVARRSYTQLRDVYASAHFVVVPLHEVDFQAGIITILEAMAMGKAVIVSRTSGQTGAVSGPLLEGARRVDIGEHASMDDTGLYVMPGDPAALRAAIEHLLAHPDEARRMGAAGRAIAESTFSLERFVERLADVIEPGGDEAPGGGSTGEREVVTV